MELRRTETFTGDIDGESPVRALQVLRDDTSASLVSMQRFRGKLGGRQGTFVLLRVRLDSQHINLQFPVSVLTRPEVQRQRCQIVNDRNRQAGFRQVDCL
jgi:Protein of unknown function (DUF3224)